jgi:MoaA/NifB/PqqE/SkfB family radical SAM enzyme
MNLSGLHLLLTYQCTFECDHCFTWGSPWQSGTMTLQNIRAILQQGKALGTVKTIYFEGGEPFLYYATLLGGVRMAAAMGFQAGIVSNAYWATSEEDALAWLQPFAGLLHDISVSSDLFHYSDKLSRQASNARAAAEKLSIPVGVISIARPDATGAASSQGQIAAGESGVMYRGRAIEKLAKYVTPRPWSELTACPHEKLDNPGRVHVDPPGNLHICQGISLGNLFRTPLSEICAAYDPLAHPITGPLLRGGPAELVRQHGVAHNETYADACHLCYEARRALRGQFPDILAPDQMYGVGF